MGVTEPTHTTSPTTIRRVIVASSLGTLFEWYDFYLYGSLAVFFGGLFFPPGNDTAQLLASLATFGAGFFVRPLGAVVFGYIGDLRSKTSGRAVYSMEFDSYAEVPRNVADEIVQKNKGE